MPIYQPNIVEIIVYHKIIKKKLGDKHEACNNKKQDMSYIDFFVNS